MGVSKRAACHPRAALDFVTNVLPLLLTAAVLLILFAAQDLVPLLALLVLVLGVREVCFPHRRVSVERAGRQGCGGKRLSLSVCRRRSRRGACSRGGTRARRCAGKKRALNYICERAQRKALKACALAMLGSAAVAGALAGAALRQYTPAAVPRRRARCGRARCRAAWTRSRRRWPWRSRAARRGGKAGLRRVSAANVQTRQAQEASCLRRLSSLACSFVSHLAHVEGVDVAGDCQRPADERSVAGNSRLAEGRGEHVTARRGARARVQVACAQPSAELYGPVDSALPKYVGWRVVSVTAFGMPGYFTGSHDMYDAFVFVSDRMSWCCT